MMELQRLEKLQELQTDSLAKAEQERWVLRYDRFDYLRNQISVGDTEAFELFLKELRRRSELPILYHKEIEAFLETLCTYEIWEGERRFTRNKKIEEAIEKLVEVEVSLFEGKSYSWTDARLPYHTYELHGYRYSFCDNCTYPRDDGTGRGPAKYICHQVSKPFRKSKGHPTGLTWKNCEICQNGLKVGMMIRRWRGDHSMPFLSMQVLVLMEVSQEPCRAVDVETREMISIPRNEILNECDFSVEDGGWWEGRKEKKKRPLLNQLIDWAMKKAGMRQNSNPKRWDYLR